MGLAQTKNPTIAGRVFLFLGVRSSLLNFRRERFGSCRFFSLIRPFRPNLLDALCCRIG